MSTTQSSAIKIFNPNDSLSAEVKIIDASCDNKIKEIEKYESVTQSIRMLNCQQKNVWSQQNRYWSMVVVGTDKSGNILFIFTRSPYSVHDFINMIVKMNIEVTQLMYLEGGPEASFFIHHKGFKIMKMGSYETDFNEDDENQRFWEIPNIIGVRKKS